MKTLQDLGNTECRMIQVFIASMFTCFITFSQEQLPFHELDPSTVRPSWSRQEIDYEFTESIGVDEFPKVSISEALQDSVFFGFQKRGLNSIEPNLRGFTGDRVAVMFNGHLLSEGSPTRTGSALNFIQPDAVEIVMRNFSKMSASTGPIRSGGHIELDSFGGQRTTGSVLQSRYSAQSDFFAASVKTERMKEKNYLNAGVSWRKNGDFRSGNDAVVDSDYEGRGGYFASQWTITKQQELWVAWNYHQQKRSRNSSLPLDSKDSSLNVITLGHNVDFGDWSWENRFGYSKSDNNLTAEDRIRPPNVLSITADADTSNLSFGSGVQRIFQTFRMRAGMDYLRMNQDAYRLRNLTAGSFVDHLWPDTWSEEWGMYAELTSDWGRGWKWRFGGRLNHYRSDAEDVHDIVALPVAPGNSILENFRILNQDPELKTEVKRILTSFNAALVKQLNETLSASVTLAHASTAPTTTERYRSFVNALGGNGSGGPAFEIGNPSLTEEKKTEIEFNLVHESQSFFLSAGVYFANVDDFTQRQVIRTKSGPTVFGFRAIDASFHGLHLNLDWEIQKLPINLFGDFSYSYGINEDTGVRLVEMPPLKAAVGGKYSVSLTEDLRIKLGLRWNYMGSRRNPQRELVPIYFDTDAAHWTDLTAVFEFRDQLQAMVRLGNFWDKQYYHFLTPPVASGPRPQNGDLKAGDLIPEQGRHIEISFKYTF